MGSTTHTLEVSSKILNLTVNDMLTLAQIESSKFRVNSSVFDIRSVVSEIMSLQQDKATVNEVKFTAEYKGFEDGFMVCTDEMRIMQILLNLQSNSLKFTFKHGSVTILVRLNK